jgi:hypothetical protein
MGGGKSGKAMNLFGAILLGCFALGSSKVCYAQALNWADSEFNWRNNSYNINNTAQLWDNNPMNWKNDPNNYESRNGIYDTDGQRVGYEVVSPQGVKNYFDNNGKRVGYTAR